LNGNAMVAKNSSGGAATQQALNVSSAVRRTREAREEAMDMKGTLPCEIYTPQKERKFQTNLRIFWPLWL
jgi:hypothetical protein